MQGQIKAKKLASIIAPLSENSLAKLSIGQNANKVGRKLIAIIMRTLLDLFLDS